MRLADKRPKTLLLHDGELADLHALLEDLQTPFVARQGTIENEDEEVPWDLIIATPQRLLSLPFHTPGSSQQRLVICDQDSRTLRNSLRRAGIELMVRRPVHPAALRALLVHALYRGPEKRRLPRASIGAPVRYRMGWRQQPAILADLSLGGCRLLTQQPAARGKTLTLILPAKLTGRRGLSLKARVLRSGANEARGSGANTVIAKFENLGRGALERLKEILDAHASGPAVLDGATAALAAQEAGVQAVVQLQQPSASAYSATPDPGADPNDRRTGPRHTIDPLILRLRDEAARVLVGRDISVGGMRVDGGRGLAVGQRVQIAIHVSGTNAPLVVTAEVHRDDGPEGMALRFVDLPADTATRLSQALEKLPVLATTGDEDTPGCIVSEILSVTGD
ncbi:MAG TPA: PilZ domain-containing protein [Myxococcota bacterium]